MMRKNETNNNNKKVQKIEIIIREAQNTLQHNNSR